MAPRCTSPCETKAARASAACQVASWLCGRCGHSKPRGPRTTFELDDAPKAAGGSPCIDLGVVHLPQVHGRQPKPKRCVLDGRKLEAHLLMQRDQRCCHVPADDVATTHHVVGVLFEAGVVVKLNVVPPMLWVHVHWAASGHGANVEALVGACGRRAQVLWQWRCTVWVAPHVP